MCEIAVNCIVILMLLLTSQTNTSRLRSGDIDIKFYEYGAHDSEEAVSLLYYGVIPAFRPLYDMKLKPESLAFESNFTYIKVAYFNLISNVKIVYRPDISVITFHIKFPFIDTPIGITGYSHTR